MVDDNIVTNICVFSLVFLFITTVFSSHKHFKKDLILLKPLKCSVRIVKRNLSFYEFWPPILDDTRTFNVLKNVLVINV